MAPVKGSAKKGYFLFTGGGPLIILTSYESIEDPGLLSKLDSKGIKKFVACEISLEAARQKYGAQYDVVVEDLKQTDDLRVLDYNGERAYTLFKFKELGIPIYHEG
jgi:hypothetical protein